MMKNTKTPKASLWKSVKVGLIAFLVMVIFAYGFQITKVNLEELSSEQRQESLIRVARSLAKPDLIEYDQTVQIVNAPVYLPCPADGAPAPADPTGSEPYLVVTPGCANPGDTIRVEGYNFAPGSSGPLRFVPGSDPENSVELGRDSVKADPDGYFALDFVLPERESPDVQYIRASLASNVGSPHFTKTARDTWDKIVETVFLALLATVFGTLLAIPLSFFAARNLMKSVRSPLASVALSVLGWPLGMAAGFWIVRGIGSLSDVIGANLIVGLLSVVICPVGLVYAVRWALPQEELVPPGKTVQMARLGVMLVAALVGFFWLYELSWLMMLFGEKLVPVLGAFGFLGNFLYQSGNILLVFVPVIGGLAAGGILGNLFGRIGQRASEKLGIKWLKVLNMVLASLAGATLLGLLGWLVEWLYQIGDPRYTFWGPMVVGCLLGLVLAIVKKAKEVLPIGLAIYFITRSFLNALRSVEALIMAIVFVIAVGIGPFAGVMALGLHTIVSLAKLYSEQVESIMSGPLEAVEATGANRLQTIVYAVIPQIVPPYISYTMYRWDINVRMSTIIGFVGGGGIGFLLQQNINLLNYRGASAQMFAIAIVVATMDYISSVLREKTI